jgi:uncharacterized protein YdbL (DUF1318 family)
MKRLFIVLLGWAFALAAVAQGNLEINSPAIEQFKSTMSRRHAQLLPWYQAGAVGLAKDGTVALRDPDSVPLSQRQSVSGLVSAENADRAGLYREIARANGNPTWEPDIRATFALRWVDRAPAGWWVQNATGAWLKK